MSHAFTFHFSYNAQNQTCILTVFDLLAKCPVCGYDEIQRFFSGVPLHPMSLKRFTQAIEEAPSRLAYSCSNCDTPVGPKDASRGAVIYGFADGAGKITAYFACHQGRGEDVTFHLEPDTPLDAQALPRWTPPENDRLSEAPITALDDAVIFDVFARTFHPKSRLRAMLLDFAENQDPLVEQVTSDAHLIVTDDPSSTSELLIDVGMAELATKLNAGEVLCLDVVTPPAQLRTAKRPEDLEGQITPLLSESLAAKLETKEVGASMLIEPSLAVELFADTLTSARLTFERTDGPLPTFSAITTPRESVYDRTIDSREIMARAAYTSITPREAARLTAEEIIATLMGLPMG